MSGTWGRSIQVTIYGESHGPGIGVVLAGLPPGHRVDWDAVRAEMDRRRPGQSDLATARREADEWEVLSGLHEGRLTGAPLCALIRNRDARSADYRPSLPRPGHADYAAVLKYAGFSDPRGGGHFSGRLTAPLVLAGAVARQLIGKRGVEIGARIQRIFDVEDAQGPACDLPGISRKPFPVRDDAAGARMKEAVRAARAQGDSVGGVVECAALGVPPGLGAPMFAPLESAIASLMFAIPAVKGIEFGDGFGLARMTGSAANDPMEAAGGTVRQTQNHNGGILGGISNGSPIVFRVAIKPTPTIGREQTTVDLGTMETTQMRYGGRHDPCIVPRAVPVVEGALALCLLDEMLAHPAWSGEWA